MPDPSNILFAGGGTGGHIFPALAILERLREKRPGTKAFFAVSNRPLDAKIMEKHAVTYTPLPVQPFSTRPWHWPAFYKAWHDSVEMMGVLLEKSQACAVVTTGGFVSGPAAAAAKAKNIPVALVNLDAVPGRANQWIVRRATSLFTVYPSPLLPGAAEIGLPMRRSVVGPADKAKARAMLGLDPQRDTLFVTAGSQGATSINRMMSELVGQHQAKKALASWQVLHLCGDKEADEVARAYAASGVTAKVLPFCDAMGNAWAGASIAISRSGAGSVAEAWANAVPTIFFPYPYHKDQHQKLNARPLTQAGSAILMIDRINPAANARELAPRLLALMSNSTHRYQMAEQLRATRPSDGADAVAAWAANIMK